MSSIIATPRPRCPASSTRPGGSARRAAIIITAGFDRGPGSHGRAIARISARKYGLRIVGPNCLGVIAPAGQVRRQLRGDGRARQGDLALISQSGAIAAALLEWARAARRRFLRHRLAGRQDRRRFRRLPRLFRAGSRHARHPALCRIHQRSPQVHVGGAGRGAHQAGRRRQVRPSQLRARARRSRTPARWRVRTPCSTPHSAAPACCASTISTNSSPRSRRCRAWARFRAIAWRCSPMAAALGVLAVDRLVDLGGRLADAFARHHAKPRRLRHAAGWSHGNPVDIVGDADAARYGAAIDAMLQDDGTDAVLVMNCPTALVSSIDGGRAPSPRPSRRTARRASSPSPSSPSGLATAPDRRRSSTTPAFPTTRPRRRRCAASCIWSPTARRRIS